MLNRRKFLAGLVAAPVAAIAAIAVAKLPSDSVPAPRLRFERINPMAFYAGPQWHDDIADAYTYHRQALTGTQIFRSYYG